MFTAQGQKWKKLRSIGSQMFMARRMKEVGYLLWKQWRKQPGSTLLACDFAMMFALRSWKFKIRADTLQRRHNERDGVSSHRRLDCLLKRLFRRRLKTKKSKLGIICFCEGKSPVTVEFPTQRHSNVEKVSIDDVIMDIVNWSPP